MKITQSAKIALSLFIGFLAFCALGIVSASLASLFLIACAPLACIAPPCALWQPIGTPAPCVFRIHAPWRVCPVCFCCGVCHRHTGPLCCGVCVLIMSENTVSTVSTVHTPVKFSGAYAGISTDVYVFLTLHCGTASTVAVKVANDAASAIGRVMVGVSREVSFGRMSKDLLSNIKETASRKGVSVNEFPLQCAYLAEKVRKFEFDNKVKIGTVELPESLAHYLADLAK